RRDRRTAEQQHDIHGHQHGSLRSSLPGSAVCDQHPLQKTSCERYLHSRGVHRSIALLVLMLALSSSAPAQDREPLLGTWRLNFAQSTFASGPPPYSRVTTKIESSGDGLKVIYDMVGERGGTTHWEWMGRLDGKDYPLEGIEEVVTNAYSR